MRKFLILTIGTACFLLGAKSKDGIKGVWLTENEQMKIEIYDAGGDLNGKIVWLEEPTDRKGALRRDEENPDKSLRDRPLMGLDMLTDLTYQDGSWNGSLYAPKRGITMDAEIKKINEDELKVVVSYRGFTRVQIWKRSN